MHQCNNQAFGPVEQQHPPFFYYTHTLLCLYISSGVFSLPFSVFTCLYLLGLQEYQRGRGVCRVVEFMVGHALQALSYNSVTVEPGMMVG